MPKFNNSTVDPKPTKFPHGRYKRSASTLSGIPFNGVNSFVNHKKQSPFQKGMKQLLERQNVTEGKMTALVTQMVSTDQITLKEIERLQTLRKLTKALKH